MDRLYPAIQVFLQDLALALDGDDIKWAQPSYRSVWVGLGTSTARPTDWTRSFIGGLFFWPAKWPQRLGKAAGSIALYAVFGFVNPGVEIGISISGPGVAVAQSKWAPHASAFVGEVKQALAAYEAIVDLGDVARPFRRSPVADVDEAWVTAAIQQMVGAAHLRIGRRLDPLTVTVQQVREAIAEVVGIIDACPSVFEMLRSSGQRASAGPATA